MVVIREYFKEWEDIRECDIIRTTMRMRIIEVKMERTSFFRTELLLGREAMKKLEQSKIIIFGVGGVGGYCVEAIARCGVKKIALVDFDTVEKTNLNRQIIATTESIGRFKTEVMQERIALLSPETEIEIFSFALTPENIDHFALQEYDYIVDAIDMFDAKIALIEYAYTHQLPIISALGAGNRLDPSQLVISDISKTYNCPLAKKVRLACKNRRIKKLTTVFSKEVPVVTSTNRQIGIPSISFVPASAGLLMASHVIRNLVKNEKKV